MNYLEAFDLDTNNKILLPGTLPEYKDKIMFVMVKANWCGHCVSTSPQFEEAAATKPANVEFCYANITGDKDEQAMKDKLKDFFKDFKGFPHLTCFRNGIEIKQYNGQRNKNAFLEFLEKV